MIGDDVDFLPTADPLARGPRLAYATELPVLGVATHFQTNSRYVLGVIEEAFGVWRGLGQSPSREAERVNVRIVVQEGSEYGPGHVLVRHLCPDTTRVIVHSPGSVGISDPARCESVAYVTTALAADRAHFRAAMLEAITFALLAHFDRHPIHAAAIARHGRAVLLAGPSGAGKSTLAYLAHTASIRVLSEDHIWVQLTPTVRLWGSGGPRVRLTPDVSTHFPEVERTGVASDAEGKRKLVVDLDEPSELVYVADCAGVCILEKGTGAATLERLEPDAIIRALSAPPAPGFDRFPERHISAVRALAGYRGWRLTLSNDPREALPLLLRMLDES